MKSKITPQSSREELEQELDRLDSLIMDFKLHIVESFDRMNLSTVYECHTRLKALKVRRAYVYNLVQ